MRWVSRRYVLKREFFFYLLNEIRLFTYKKVGNIGQLDDEGRTADLAFLTE